MVNINFVPDDYVQSNESRRTNLMYLVLLAVVMTALGSSFTAIKIRQGAWSADETRVNTRMAKMQETIRQVEELQTKRRAMMKTALTTAELLEPVPRSVLLASLTNNLPPGVSLLELKLVQKQPKQTAKTVATSKYRAAQVQKNASQSEASPQEMQTQDSAFENPETLLETHIDIAGMAPSDLEVAHYIERLSNSTLLDNVALVESKEHTAEDNTFRQFKLTAMLGQNVHLTKEDVESIRNKARDAVWSF